MLKRITTRALLQLYVWQVAMVLYLWKPRKKKKTRKPSNIYYSIKGFPFDKFLDYYVDKDIRGLVIEPTNKGWVTEKLTPILKKLGIVKETDYLELVQAGEQIKLQFFEETAGATDVANMSNQIKKQRLEAKLIRIQAIVDSLSINYNEELAGLLKGLGIMKVPKPETIDEDLKMVIKEAKRYVLEIQQIEEHIKATNKKGEAPKREHFENILTEYDAKLMPEHIDALRFCVLYNKLKRRKEQEDGKRKN